MPYKVSDGEILERPARIRVLGGAETAGTAGESPVRMLGSEILAVLEVLELEVELLAEP